MGPPSCPLPPSLHLFLSSFFFLRSFPPYISSLSFPPSLYLFHPPSLSLPPSFQHGSLPSLYLFLPSRSLSPPNPGPSLAIFRPIFPVKTPFILESLSPFHTRFFFQFPEVRI